ncbi:MAG: heme o synthase [Rhodobacteraceae bacterium]|nr:heme o synthase [Paracoccaceae bacterium]
MDRQKSLGVSALAGAPASASSFDRFDEIDASFNDYWRLMKPRVMSLVVFTALAGLVAAPLSVHPVIALASLLCVAIGAGASGALNMWWDADIDARMERTQSRPVPRGAVGADEALAVGVALAVLSVALLSLFANFTAAALLALTIAYYVFIYTMWLKRRTPQNIVIGGAAGAFPPMIGWAIATGGVSLEAIILFGIIFFWTPPHSWALALFRNNDYTAVGVPMMPVVAGDRETRRQIWLYSLVMAPMAMAPLLMDIGGPIYALVVGVATFRFVQLAWGLYRRDADAAAADRFRAEKKFFGYSIVYLFTVFSALMAEAAWRAVMAAAF